MRIYFLVAVGFWLGCCSCGFGVSEAESMKDDETMTIDNGIVSVCYDVNKGSFTARRGDRLFIKEAHFGRAGEKPTAETIRMEDGLGEGEGIQVKFASGYVYTVAVYKGLPFVFVRASVRNSSSEPMPSKLTE